MGAKKMELITLDAAIEMITAHWGNPMYKKSTLYNKICAKEIRRYGPKHRVLLDREEVFMRFCSGR